MHSKIDLVTGAAGFVGSHLVDALLEHGDLVWGVDNLKTGSLDNLSLAQANPNFCFTQADVCQPPDTYLDKEWLDQAAQAELTVFHLASIASPPLYQQFPRATYMVNAFATDQLLEYLTKHFISYKFVFASTSEVYGDPKEHPQTESYWGNVNPNGLRSCYDESKRLGETICGVFTRQHQVDTRIARIFNTYGPRMAVGDGRIIPNLITQALKSNRLTVFGNGEQTRSYCYVSDLVRGLIELATNPNAKGETVNLGNPEEFTINQTAQLVYQATTGKSDSAPIEYSPLPADDPTRRRPDISKANSLLSWQPQISFAEGLVKTIEWFR